MKRLILLSILGSLSTFSQQVTQPPTGAAGGGLAGTYPNPSIAALSLTAVTYNSGGTTTCNLISAGCSFTMAAGNTTLAFSNVHGVGPYTMAITQDSSVRTITYPGTVQNFPQPSPTSGTVSNIEFFYDGTNYWLISATTNDTSVFATGPTRAAPGGNPGSGNLFAWWDSTANMPQYKDSSGNLNSTVRTASSGTANSWVDWIATTGIPHVSQPASTNLSDSSALVRNNASNTYTTGTQDASGAAHTLPALKGTIAGKPGTCTQGEVYFATDAVAGQNWFFCTATNTWTQQLNSGGGAAGSSLFSTTNSTTATATSATSLIGTVTGSTTVAVNTFTAGQFLQVWAQGYYSTPATPASLTIDLKIGGTVRITTGAIVQIASVTNGVWTMRCGITTRTAGAGGTQIADCIYEATGSTLTPGEAPMFTSSTWSIDTTATQVIDIAATWSTTTGAPTITSTNVVAFIPGAPVTSVDGLTGAVTGITQTIASGTSALGTGAVSSATCATVVTTSATGTLTTDVVSAGFNGDPTAVTGYVPLTTGMLTIIAYPTANNVNFKVCNNTSGSITPGAITLNWRVTR